MDIDESFVPQEVKEQNRKALMRCLKKQRV